MKIIYSIAEMQTHSNLLRQQGKTIAFVPTMGFLHDGHLALIREGRKRADSLIVSIFINPAQFGPTEDLKTYPRNFSRDLELTRKEGVDCVFAPSETELYPAGFQTFVSLETLPGHLCGISRPHFFRGVATVVTKLFNIVNPQVAIFGQKDFQQLAVIRRMVQDLNFDIEIVGCPTVREADGLAMSSRNSYLSPDQRRHARCLYEALENAQVLLDSGIDDAGRLIKGASERILSHPQTDIDYIAVCDPETLEDITTINKPALMALAVKIGATRLIDNRILDPSEKNKGDTQ
ncbi:MAG: pantoate--beta-alanine ligase [Desulfobacterales bacterium]|nr:pantoate--beta-alanine ligase [Desulfobacterales bacterium]